MCPISKMKEAAQATIIHVDLDSPRTGCTFFHGHFRQSHCLCFFFFFFSLHALNQEITKCMLCFCFNCSHIWMGGFRSCAKSLLFMFSLSQIAVHLFTSLSPPGIVSFFPAAHRDLETMTSFKILPTVCLWCVHLYKRCKIKNQLFIRRTLKD